MILDEATEGLAPIIGQEIWDVLELKLKESGQAILVIDKHPKAMARIADRHLRHGQRSRGLERQLGRTPCRRSHAAPLSRDVAPPDEVRLFCAGALTAMVGVLSPERLLT